MMRRQRRFGMGLDLQYGDPHGLIFTPGVGDRLSPRIARLLEREAPRLDSVFFSLQPMDRSLLDPARYFPAWDAVMEAAPAPALRGLHHTMLNLGTVEHTTDRGRLLDFTNAMIERYGFAWVNEDLGQWSIDGKLLPYPLPPILTEAGLRRAIRHVEAVQARLAAPLVVEFPGFSEGTNFMLGDLHAYDFFRRLAEETGVAVTLDTGHLLSYQWLLGKRGEALFDDLERLPLAHCFEIHCSGCQIISDRFVDVHHGVLRPEQLELLPRLLDLCPSVQCVAYEDPKVDENGALRPKAQAGYERLRAIVELWKAAGEPTAGPAPRLPEVAEAESHEAGELEASLLRRLLFDTEIREKFVAEGPLALPEALRALVADTDREQLASTARRMAVDARTRQSRGVGPPGETFASVFDGWDTPAIEAMYARFLDSSEYSEVDELPDRPEGACVEEALYRFLEARKLGDPAARRRAFLGAMSRLLTVTPVPAFRIPPELRATPRGWVAIARGEGPPMLFGAVDGRCLTGPVTEGVAARIEGLDPPANDTLGEKLRALGLLA